LSVPWAPLMFSRPPLHVSRPPLSFPRG
jgi:hypothetical protein